MFVDSVVGSVVIPVVGMVVPELSVVAFVVDGLGPHAASEKASAAAVNIKNILFIRALLNFLRLCRLYSARVSKFYYKYFMLIMNIILLYC